MYPSLPETLLRCQPSILCLSDVARHVVMSQFPGNIIGSDRTPNTRVRNSRHPRSHWKISLLYEPDASFGVPVVLRIARETANEIEPNLRRKIETNPIGGYRHIASSTRSGATIALTFTVVSGNKQFPQIWALRSALDFRQHASYRTLGMASRQPVHPARQPVKTRLDTSSTVCARRSFLGQSNRRTPAGARRATLRLRFGSSSFRLTTRAPGQNETARASGGNTLWSQLFRVGVHEETRLSTS